VSGWKPRGGQQGRDVCVCVCVCVCVRVFVCVSLHEFPLLCSDFFLNLNPPKCESIKGTLSGSIGQREDKRFMFHEHIRVLTISRGREVSIVTLYISV